MAKQRAHRRDLDDLSGVHDRDPLAGRRHDAKVMRDQQDRRAGPARPGRAADRGCARRSRRRGRSSARRRSAGAARWRAPCAIITRWHMPPENWWAYWRARRSGSGMPTSASISMARRRAAALAKPAMQVEQPRHLLADGDQRVERGAGRLGDHGDLGAADLLQVRPRRNSARSRPPSTMLPRVRRPGLRMRRRIAVAVTDLPEPDSPTRPRISPSRTSKLAPSTASTSP